MLSTLILGMMLTGRLGLDKMQSPNPSFRALPSPGIKQIDLQFQERTKRCILYLEKEIEMYEKELKELPMNQRRFPTLYTQKDANRIWRHMERLKGYLNHEKKVGQLLEWYQHKNDAAPGSATEDEFLTQLSKLIEEHEAWMKAWECGLIAPMPREVKKN